MIRFLFSAIVVFHIFALFPGSSHALRLYSHDEYQAARHKAVTAARAGEHKGALRSLGRLLKLEPDNLGALYDYITVLIWDEQYGKALDLIPRLDLEQAPEYVVRSLAIAADRAGRDDTTDMLMKHYLKRYPRVPQNTPERIAGMTHGQLARALTEFGMTQTALSVFKNRSEASPHDQVLLADYITALVRSERYDTAINLLPRVDLQIAPEFVFDSLLLSCKQLGQLDVKRQILTVFHQRFTKPSAPDPVPIITEGEKKPLPVKPAVQEVVSVDPEVLDQAQKFLEQQKYTEAEQILRPLYLSGSKNKDVLLLSAQLFAGKGQYIQVAYVYEQLLAQEPRNVTFKRNLILNLFYAGAPFQALSLIQADPHILTRAEIDKIRVDSQAFSLRWSGYALEPHVKQGDVLDDLLLDMDQEQAQLLVAKDSYNARRSQLDSLVALQQRGRSDEVIQRYAKLAQGEQPLPDYVLIVVADAYLDQQQPVQAQKLYIQLLKNDPNLSLKQSLLYTYFDTGEYGKAQDLMAELAATTPTWRKDHTGNIVKNNEEKLQVGILVANGHAYCDDLTTAQKQYEKMRDLAPYNPEIRENLARIYRWRGWPEKAYAEIMIGQTFEPDNLYLGMNLIQTLTELYRFPEAEEQLHLWQKKAPDNKQVQALTEDWQQRDKRLFLLWVDKGKSDASSSNYGNSDFTLESYLYDRYYDHFRPFIHQYYTQADFDEGSGRYERFGVGGEYKKNRHVLSATLTGSYAGSTDAGLSVQTVHDLTDHVQVSFAYDSFSTDIPVRAYFHDITGHGYKAAGTYRLHESAGVALAYAYLDFSDGNDRHSWSLSIDQRVVNTPRFKTTLIPSVYYSRNSQAGGPYFNPEDDRSLALSVRNEWLTCQFYDRSFYQILELNAGGYYQKHFGTNATNAIVYQHRWVIDKSLEFSYGGRLAHNYYDGNKEKRESVFGSLSWRF